MPPQQQIHNFTGNLIAFWRPIKHTYHALSWNATLRKWQPSTQPIVGATKRRSTAHGAGGAVTINLRSGALIQISSNAEYLLNGETAIPIVKRTGGGIIPNAYKNHDFTVVGDDTPYLYNLQLWTVVPPVAATAVPAAPAVVPTVTVPVVVGVRSLLEPVPKRIAWLIAEDASKNNDICSISMEPISPLTAGVTTCFHCFEHAAISVWLTTHDTCPQCRKKCLVTQAFTSD
jgi:hypothetical protein